MFWIIAVVAVVAVLGYFEWKSRNKPLARGLQNHTSVHSAAQNGEGRSAAGGHDI
jgi:hypothetical protein